MSNTIHIKDFDVFPKIRFNLLLLRKIILIVLLLFFYSSAQDVLLVSAKDGGVVFNKSEKMIVYKLLLAFNSRPLDYWIQVDKNESRLVLDFYGVHINIESEITFSSRAIFKKIESVNSSTKLALNGKHSNIFISVEKNDEWHCKTENVGNDIIQVVVWRYVSKKAPAAASGKKKSPIRYILIATIAALSAFGVVYLGVGLIDK